MLTLTVESALSGVCPNAVSTELVLSFFDEQADPAEIYIPSLESARTSTSLLTPSAVKLIMCGRYSFLGTLTVTPSGRSDMSFSRRDETYS